MSRNGYTPSALLIVLVCWPLFAQKPDMYFPKGVFTAGKSDGSFAAQWFAGQLSALGEPPLLGRHQDAEPVYRFLLLPSFSHPVSVRVVLHPDGTGTVTSKAGSGQGGYAPKHPIQEKTRQVSTEEVKKLRELLGQERFWEQPAEPPKLTLGCDGTEWVMEGSQNGRYHVIDRWEGGSLTRLGRHFLGDLALLGDDARNASATEH